MIPSLLGYQRVGVNEIAIDEEEAKTVRLIFDMYRAGYHPDTIANVLMKLGRKTHQRTTKAGKVIGGNLKWTGSSVVNIIRNERRAGDILAQKTITPDFKDHKSVPNKGELPQFYAKDQHEAIVPRDEYLLANRMLDANAGGWKYGIQELSVFDSGVLKGFVGAVPNWRGFDREDYNRAGLRASGYSEEHLQGIENRIQEQIEEEERKMAASAIGFQHRYSIDSDDYDLFPDTDVVEEDEKEKKAPKESFSKWVDRESVELSERVADKFRFSSYDFSRCEVFRPEFFCVREKACATFDHKGVVFNAVCNRKLSGEELSVEHVDIYYNPVEKLVLIKKANEKTPKSLHWSHFKNNTANMRWCSSVGLVGTIFENMGWDPEIKYRVLGRKVTVGNEEVIVFSLTDSFMIVPARKGSMVSLDTSNLSAEETKELMRDGRIPQDETIPDLDDFKLGSGPMSKSAKIMQRSRAIYYDEITNRVSGTIHVSELGEKQFDPKCIQSLIQRGITPEEGWIYLKGMAVIGKYSFTIYPEDWSDSCGERYYQSAGFKINERFAEGAIIENGIPYGWTVGLDLPSPEDIRKEIEALESEKAV